MTYPYTGRNLFLQPKSYAYAVCDRDNYLNDWKVSRKGAKNALVKQASAEYEIKVQPEANLPQGAITLASILRQSLKHEILLDPIVVKFEVFGRLFAWYQDNGRHHPDSPIADLQTYILFAERLCEIAENSASLKHLSTLLKVCDSLASQAAQQFRPEDANRLADVLDREHDLVDGISISE